MPKKVYAYGNCYATSEALYHILGGKKSGWEPMYIYTNTMDHWYLRHIETGIILDASRLQFKHPDKVPYDLGEHRDFLTKRPSQWAKPIMIILTWFNKFKNLTEGIPE